MAVSAVFTASVQSNKPIGGQCPPVPGATRAKMMNTRLISAAQRGGCVFGNADLRGSTTAAATGLAESNMVAPFLLVVYGSSHGERATHGDMGDWQGD